MHLRLRRHAITVVTTGIVLVAVGNANAQDAPPSGPVLSITPFVAMGDDLAPGGGAAISYGWTRRLFVEGEASLGTDAFRSSVSLLYTLPHLGQRVYVAGGLGFQRDDFETIGATNESPRVIDKKAEFAVNVGAGITVPIRRGWSYRSDFRWYNPAKEWPESWRVFSGFVIGRQR
jgi:hypothetical protein